MYLRLIQFFSLIRTSPFGILNGKTGNLQEFSKATGGNDIYYIFQIVFFVIAVCCFLGSMFGLLFSGKPAQIAEKRAKITRILVIVAWISGGLIFFSLLKSILDMAFDFYAPVYYIDYK